MSFVTRDKSFFVYIFLFYAQTPSRKIVAYNCKLEIKKKINAKQVQVTYNQWIFVFQKVLLFMTPTSNDNFQSAITNCFSIFALIENQLEKWVFINN